ncbi:MerR family transcriptional regulator [Candidatus Leptofilum sp.]|uniref:MerR family transcriptional regulator n=1 Tax=Candidatus Leptofilum sp. TaxID=3241576 RepID=UPI003B5CA8DD
MFRIGEFSRIAQTTIIQLRHYDQIGLFQPEYIDQFTGYRYYRATQLPDLNRILAMKDLGLTLEQIKQLVQEKVSVDELRGMLTLKKAQVEQELSETVATLRLIDARLSQIEREGGMSHDDVVIKEIPAQPFFGFRAVLPDTRKVGKITGEMRRLLPSRVSKKKLGYFTAVFHANAFLYENVDVEMGFLLNDALDMTLPLSSGYELIPRILPRVEMAACVVRVGGPDKAVASYANVGRWIEANGYHMGNPVREMFIVPPSPGKFEETVCEIQIPVSFEPGILDKITN